MEMQKLSLTQLAPTHSLHFDSPSYQNRKLFSPTRNPMSNVLHKANLAVLSAVHPFMVRQNMPFFSPVRSRPFAFFNKTRKLAF
jgi:hypothetical protein